MASSCFLLSRVCFVLFFFVLVGSGFVKLFGCVLVCCGLCAFFVFCSVVFCFGRSCSGLV